MTLNHKRDFDDAGRERLERFTDRLFDASYTELGKLRCTAYLSGEPLSFAQRLRGERRELREGDVWAKEVFDCAWFHVTGDLPAGFADSELALLLDCGGEGLVYDTRGNVKQGITCHASDFCDELGVPVKRVVFVDESLHPDGRLDFWIDCGANDLFGNMKKQSRVNSLAVAKINCETRALAYDIQVLLTVCDASDDKAFGAQIYNAIEAMAQLPVVDETTAARLRTELKPLLERENEGEGFTYYAVGHAHLDLAWLWPLRESYRKGARTFATQIKNIELYPEYVFGASQAQLYEWVRDRYPAVYSKVQALAKTPNWDVQGATWVEMDSNLIGGESMVRQFFYGKKFFREEFGQDMKLFWVPDSFGYSACLPQVMRLAGVPYFLTQKISWNTYNKFPYHTFRWEGLDGSRVFAHMLPEDTYNAPMRGDFLVAGENNYAERAQSNVSMSLYGIGDGGAGPGYEHIERARRYANLRGIPKVKMSKSLPLFERLDDGKTAYNTHRGELYLEKHQGTYTTQSANKRFNRKCEFALRNYEMLMPLARERGIELPIDHAQLERLWKEILLYQFHDILPGSSIDRVYRETTARYTAILAELTNAAALLCETLFGPAALVNLNSFGCEKTVKLGKKWYRAALPALGVVSLGEEDVITSFSASSGYHFIENDCVRVEFADGCIRSLYDKELQKEFVRPGKRMAVLSQYTDTGDCWDIPDANADYIQTGRTAQCVHFKTGTDGARAYAVAQYRVGDCTLTQEFSLTDGERMVSCTLTMDVRQQSAMLRAAFPVNIETEVCHFNLQFGHIGRSTTENNSVELAQYEVSGNKFADMSDEVCGLSFINDCKYGYRCKHGVIDLNLVRTPQGGPGTNVDQGVQVVHYGLLPHAGSLGKETYQQAYALNNPPLLTGGVPCAHGIQSAYTTDNEAVILETVKEAEDGDGLVVRFYNCTDLPQTARVALCGYKPAAVVDIPENTIAEKTDGTLCLRPFELVNIRFTRV